MAKIKIDQLKEAVALYEVKAQSLEITKEPDYADLKIQPEYVINTAGVKKAVVIPIDEWQSLLRAYRQLLKKLDLTKDTITFWSDEEIDQMGQMVSCTTDIDDEDYSQW